MTCEHILVVEDVADIRDTIKDILTLEGYEVLTAANGREALERLNEQQQPCLILLDLMMPVMDGWQFLEALETKHQHVLATIPIVVVSAAADVASVQQKYGCRIMKKPCNVNLLVDLAHEYCEKSQ